MKKSLQLLLLSSLVLLVGSSVAQTKPPPKSSLKFPLTLEHELGNTILPKQPVRIASLGEEVTDLLFALETSPNAVGSSRVASNLALNTLIPKADFYNRPFYRAAPFMGGVFEPSIEALLTFKPDLILSVEPSKTLHKNLSRVAPTLSFNVREPGWWRLQLPKVALALGREPQAKAFLSRYDRRVVALKKRLAPTLAKTPRVAVLYPSSATDVYIFNSRGIIAQGLAELGFTIVVPKGVGVGPNGAAISLEKLATLEADRVITLRVAASNGQFETYPAITLLKKRGLPTLSYNMTSSEPSSGPTTDLKRLEEFARLLEGSK